LRPQARDVNQPPRTKPIGLADLLVSGAAIARLGAHPGRTGLAEAGAAMRADSQVPGDPEALVQLVLPPEAALYLADELNRQAQRSLDEQSRKHESADASGSRATTPRSD
jgi:hypothetical protein